MKRGILWEYFINSTQIFDINRLIYFPLRIFTQILSGLIPTITDLPSVLRNFLFHS